MLRVEPLCLPLRMRGTPRNDDGHTKMLGISPLSFFHSNCHWGNAASPLPKCPALCSGACRGGLHQSHVPMVALFGADVPQLQDMDLGC